MPSTYWTNTRWNADDVESAMGIGCRSDYHGSLDLTVRYVLIVLLGSDRKLMKDKVSGTLSKTLTWIGTGAMAAAALTLVLVTFVLK